MSVVRSPKRRKTVEAKLRGQTIELRIPASMSADEEAHWVAEMRRRFERARDANRIDLAQRAGELCAEYGLPQPITIRWVDNQQSRWASCTPSTSTIRISQAAARFPAWVIDYLLVHELAHLVHADHSSGFWSLVNRYPRTERARGYLAAKSEDDS
ncbi:MAG: M48 family metallopeptidase [Actinomycetia bacterium]|nr:M48 family metallopeptidase [Actinomycetes bacterium]